MCWIINKNKFEVNPETFRKIADKDITVYKLGYMKGKDFSPFFHHDNFLYGINKHNEEVKLELTNFRDSDLLKIAKGYHSFSGECVCYVETFCRFDGERKLMKISISYAERLIGTLERLLSSTKCVGEFIIPKGSEYYIDEEGVIVSSQLIWTGKHAFLRKSKFYKSFKLKDICVGE